MKILGISAFYHDSAACLIDSGKIVAAAQEERFTRKKHDSDFPLKAVQYCLAEGGIGSDGLDAVAFYDKPLLKLHRILETYLSIAPKGLQPYMRALPIWLREKLWTYPEIEESLKRCGVTVPDKIYFPEHHESHAASAFFPSPFSEAAVLTMDGVGEWSTTSIAVGEGNKLRMLKEIKFPHSLGMLYSAFTYYLGFKVNSGEYKLMGLAPYGEPKYVDIIKDNLIDIKDDGSYRLNMDYFSYLEDLVMTNSKFADLFGAPARKSETDLTLREMDIARSIQVVTEEVVLKLATHAREATGKKYACLAGGVALNCVANGVLLREGIFEDIWIQPAAGDAGGALGAALAVWHNVMDGKREQVGPDDQMSGAYLGLLGRFGPACTPSAPADRYLCRPLRERNRQLVPQDGPTRGRARGTLANWRTPVSSLESPGSSLLGCRPGIVSSLWGANGKRQADIQAAGPFPVAQELKSRQIPPTPTTRSTAANPGGLKPRF